MSRHSASLFSLCILLYLWPIHGQELHNITPVAPPTNASLEVRIISAQMLEPSMSLGLVFIGAAMHLAVRRANEKYAQRGLRFVVRPVEGMYSQSCLTAGTYGVPNVTDYYYMHHLDQHTPGVCNIYFTHSCTDYFQMLCLSSEWNAFFFNNGIATLLSFPPRSLPAYSINLAGTEMSVARTLWRIMGNFNWSHVAFILDTKSPSIFYSTILNAAKRPPLRDGHVDPYVSITTYPVQASDNASIVTGLLRAKESSRVFVLFATASVSYLITVFLSIQPVQNSYYGKASLFNNPTPLMLNLTRNFIYMTFHESGGTDYKRQMNSDLRQLTYDLYNVTYEPGFQPLSNHPTGKAYTSIELISQVLADNMEDYQKGTTAQRAAFCTGDHLASLFFNQTFKLPQEEVSIDASGFSTMDVDIWMFDSQTRNMSVIAVYRAVSGNFEWQNTSEIDWRPPLDVPLCGFSGTEGPCRPQGVVFANIVAPVVVVLLIVFCAALFGVRRRLGRNIRSGYWWLLSEEDLDAGVVMGATEVVNPVSWRSTTVWMTTMDVQGRPNLSLLRKLVPDATHPNVNALLGVVILPHRAFILSDYCKRGSLPMILEVMKLDQDFQLSMARDLAKGLNYLHNSIGRPHGHLRSACCLIDDRFTLRIGQFGFAAISHALFKGVGFSAPKKAQGLPADMYAAGQILLLIVHQHTTKTTSRLAVKAASIEVEAAETDAAGYDAESRLVLLANRCLYSNAALRPTAKQLLTGIGRLRVAGQSASRSIVERIIRRFEAYTQVLDEAVRIKTVELQMERKRCDDLLRELLPRSVVEQLRNREVMVAEYYPCVSVFFSDLDGFVTWASSVLPEMVIGTVTTLFCAFDGAIQEMNVYKVETIRDSYMTVSGIPPRGDHHHASEICRMAVKLMKVFEDIEASSKMDGHSREERTAEPVSLRLRCGIHSGPCCAGVIGMRVPRYCLFGDTVNVAARMNSHGEGGRIHLSQATHDLLVGSDAGLRFRLQERGMLSVKGKGDMRTFWLSS
ncbi:atrial natriuretic peptide receptor 1-like [Paramacrobiotus metropolitanus]|uniref:atrial natriuretic peptide receptor 1-like n=1 Tax=Paramacrobiotus metropolitanus TaxID=2943436 RepID=UPI0024457AFB|nr:atrial natriuretic peptide receptor 1-like [Paramacrobiotus metropolitanus]